MSTVTDPSGLPVIELSGAAKSYAGPPVVQALRPVDLVVDEGEYLAVVGPSGSGKSTLLNLIGLLDRPSTGEVRITGLDTGALSEAERTALRGQQIGFVFQAFHLLAHRTAVDNVALGQLYTRAGRRARHTDAEAALERVGLGHRLDALPPTLSGGERQRVAIARALVNRPRLLLCDEPTGNLDSATAGSVMDLFEELNRAGVTILIITHDQTVAARAQHRATILDGRLACLTSRQDKELA